MWEVDGPAAVAYGYVVKPFILGELHARESVGIGRDPFAGCSGPFHPFLGLWRGAFHESSMKVNFSIPPSFPVGCTSNREASSVCLDADGLVANEGAGNHFCCIDGGSVDGGSMEDGVVDCKSASLDTIPRRVQSLSSIRPSLPRIADRKFVQSTCSTGARRGPMPGTVRHI